jgi:hypothetical protein
VIGDFYFFSVEVSNFRTSQKILDLIKCTSKTLYCYSFIIEDVNLESGNYSAIAFVGFAFNAFFGGCRFKNILSRISGGVIYVNYDCWGMFTFFATEFKNCISESGNGGAIFFSSSITNSLKLMNVKFERCSVDLYAGRGGAIYLSNRGVSHSCFFFFFFFLFLFYLCFFFPLNYILF